jgi:cytochrome P450 family 9
MKVTSIITNFTSFTTSLKMIGFFAAPKLMQALKINLFDSKTMSFFTSAIRDTMREREKQGIVRNDMIDLLLQAKKGNLEHENTKTEDDSAGFATVEESDLGKQKIKHTWGEDYLIAQAFIFFFAGFETISTAMSFIAYELIANPEVQQKLQDEIDSVEASLEGGDLNYESVQKMKYMDMVISEALRKWPAAPIIDRMCTRPYTLEYDNKKIDFEVGRNFFIPVSAFHHNEEYFPNPYRFDPERFNDENKGNINPDVYLPFGIGPRNCIGSRFALLEMKILFYHLLLNFNFKATSKTQMPMKLLKSQVIFQMEKGLHLALVPR